MEKNKKILWTVVAVLAIVAFIIVVQMSPEPASTNDTDTQTVDNSATTPTPTKTTSVTTSSKTSAVKELGSSVVQLTDKGFSPFILEINRGGSVEFLNESGKTMIIRSYEDKPENLYPGFEQTGAPLGRGGKFYFGFTTPGAWAYYNLNSPNDKGVIVVK